MRTTPTHILHHLIKENPPFPNNPRLPVLVYRGCFDGNAPFETAFRAQNWQHIWKNGIHPYHHFHSNTHEALGVVTGACTVQLGGDGRDLFEITQGDLILIPAGVSHKRIVSTDDFLCVGAYPSHVLYDLCTGDESEYEQVKRTRERVPLPKTDPIYGESGPLFDYWK